jgi:hypothetical protein
MRYSVLEPGSAGSARGTAKRLHELLAAGKIEEAAFLSNSPRRRYEVLRDYRDRVGEEEFERVYQAYLRPESRVYTEIAMGPHRLLIWELGEISHLAGEYYVEVEGRMLLDDVPSEARTQLRRVLNDYRRARRAASEGEKAAPEAGAVPEGETVVNP